MLLPGATEMEEGSDAGEAVLRAMNRLEHHQRSSSSGVDWDRAMKDNPWLSPPAAVVSLGRESIASFYKAWAAQGLKQVQALKVVMVGATRAGKTRYVSMNVLSQAVLT